MKMPTINEVLHALSFATAGPDGGLRVNLSTPTHDPSIVGIPTKDGRISLTIRGEIRKPGIRGLHPTGLIMDEIRVEKDSAAINDEWAENYLRDVH